MKAGTRERGDGSRDAFGAMLRVFRGLSEHEAFRSAAAVAFWFFLSLVPLLVLAGFLVGQVARRRGVETLSEPLLQVVPFTAEDLVREEIGRLAGGTSTLAPLGALAYLWAASSGVHNLLDVFDRALSLRPRPYWKKRAIAVGWVLFGLATTCALASVLVRVDQATRAHVSSAAAHDGGPSAGAQEAGAGRLGQRGSAHSRAGARPRRAPRTRIEQALAAGVTLAVGTAFLATFLRFSVARPPGRRRRVWPGTLTAVSFWLAVSWAFGAYAASIANYALYYGSLAAVAVLLIWLYLTSLSLILGVEVNAMLEDVRRPEGRREDAELSTLLAS